jgi:uncharacterized membrane protein
MIAIQPISDAYQFMGIVHILTVIVAFGPLFVYPSLHRAGATETMAKLHMRISMPAMFLVWVLGMGLTGMSDRVFRVADGWVAASVVIWAVLMGVSWFLIRPAVSDDSPKARSMLAAGTGITHLLLVVALYLMVFKPGA